MLSMISQDGNSKSEESGNTGNSSIGSPDTAENGTVKVDGGRTVVKDQIDQSNTVGADGTKQPTTPRSTSLSNPAVTEYDDGRRDSLSSNISTATTESRRRSKVSRACDQCRKKKIKCDYIEGLDSNADQSCSGCRKIGEKCCFERIPLKRGPSKGYTRSNSQSTERRGSQHRRSSSDASQRGKKSYGSNSINAPAEPKLDNIETPVNQGQSSSSTANVSLPPLLQHLPGMNQPAISSSSAASLQQPFWKVPYHEYQYQRRPSLDSLASDNSQKVGGKINQQLVTQPQQQSLQTIGTSRSNTGPLNTQDAFRNQRYYYQSSQGSVSEAESDNRRGSSAIPPLLNPALQQQPQQYSYSQFAMAQQQQQQQQQQQHLQLQIQLQQQLQQQQQQQQQSLQPSQLNSTKAATGLSNGGFAAYSANRGHSSGGHVLERTDSAASDAISINASPNVFAAESESAPTSPAQKKRKKSNRSSTSKKGKSSSQNVPLTRSTMINYGQIDDVQLVDTYYEYVHLRFPVIPVNKETFTNDLLLVNAQPISELHEFNNYILLWFRNSLELLIRICLKNKESEEVLYQQSTFVSAINECFQKIVDIHPRFRDLETEIDDKVATIYLVTFIILNCTLALVNYNNSFVLGMSVIIFNELKLWKNFIFTDWKTISKHDIMCLRLYFELNVFDSLQSCCFGVPKLMDLRVDETTVTKLFCDKVIGDVSNEEVLKWNVDQDQARVKTIVDNMELGYFLTKLCQSRRSSLNQPLPPVVNHPDGKTIPSLFRKFLSLKRQFTDVLLESPDLEGNLPDMTPELVTRLSNMICDLTATVYELLKLNVDINPTNCLELFSGKTSDPEPDSSKGKADTEQSDEPNFESGTVSPFIIAIYKDLYNVVELIKNMPTSLIGCVMGTQAPNFDSQPLVLQLSHCMNNMLQITTFTSTLRPFKVFKHELNAQVKNKSLETTPLWKQKMQSSLPPLQKAVTPQQIMMTQFIDIAWCIADTEELGWFNS